MVGANAPYRIESPAAEHGFGITARAGIYNKVAAERPKRCSACLQGTQSLLKVTVQPQPALN
jgi:hypothetical protein